MKDEIDWQVGSASRRRDRSFSAGMSVITPNYLPCLPEIGQFFQRRAGECTMLLEEGLRNRSEQFSAETSSEIVAAMLRADVTLIASGLAQHALRAGDFAPDFNLTGVRGTSVSLSSLRKSGPVVISFYRGDWCPRSSFRL
jgi:AhpC/TSA family